LGFALLVEQCALLTNHPLLHTKKAPKGAGFVWRDIVDAMRTFNQTRQAIVKLNMAYVYRLRRASFFGEIGFGFFEKSSKLLEIE
jgi:hypothetical protein